MFVHGLDYERAHNKLFGDACCVLNIVIEFFLKCGATKICAAVVHIVVVVG
jgi:hypothetical protein